MTTSGSGVDSSSTFDPFQIFNEIKPGELLASMDKMVTSNRKTLRLKGLRGERVAIALAQRIQKGSAQDMIKALEDQIRNHKKYVVTVHQKDHSVTRYATKDTAQGIREGSLKFAKIKKKNGAPDTTKAELTSPEKFDEISDEAAAKIAQAITTLSLQAFQDIHEEVKPVEEHHDTVSTDSHHTTKAATSSKSIHKATNENEETAVIAEEKEEQDIEQHPEHQTTTEILKEEEQQLEEVQKHEKELREDDEEAHKKHVLANQQDLKIEEHKTDAIQHDNDLQDL